MNSSEGTKRLSDEEIFTTDCSFAAVRGELQARGVRHIVYKQWSCYLIGFANYSELQFIEYVPIAAPAVALRAIFCRPHGLPAVLGCDGMRLWWDNDGVHRGTYTAYQSAFDAARIDVVPANSA